ncbi:3-phosphoinositide dependent protein kinase-1 [Clonorchis sinensis]|uniref:3-phosphoinositide-dependent protein kinase 1 n=1 Tax=Clonorchis sinensis TaxID=79923 RepID=A0A8T1M973_CLOSI|nr:3-phosphoinositide dependent protein kinase-1 [Clonorchis sinensis]
MLISHACYRVVFYSFFMSGEDQGSSHRRAVPRPSDFRFGKEIGQGSFSNVYVVREIASNAEFAMKVVEKQHVVRNKAVESVHMEKAVLTRVNHVFIIRLHYTFQDSSRLFFVLEYARGGELLTHLNRLTSFDLPCSRFYAAEILVALNYLHTQSIVHRDIKPENVLLTETMHIKLADFGSAIILNDPKVKAPGFTGTPEYVSPEMLSSRSFADESSPSSSQSFSFEDTAYLMDYWAFGCVVYQFISGRPPFRTEKHHHAYDIFGQILGLSYKFLDGFDTVARDLVQKLLVINPMDRLGSPTNGGPVAVQEHLFFSGIDWDSLPNQPAPILLPNLEPIAPSDWDSLPAGFDEGQMYLLSCEFASAVTPIPETERSRLLSAQERQNPYHRFVRNRLILKQGVLFKRRGLFARKRMFLLTEGPHLFYVDMDAMSLKGEVPWSSFLTLELKSDKLFFIRIPNRTFYLEDPSGKAAAWVAQLSAVKQAYYAEPSCGVDPVLSTQNGKVAKDCAAIVQS